MRKRSEKKKPEQNNNNHAYWIAAACLALGAVLILALVMPENLVALSGLATFSKYLLGKGSFILPVAFFACAWQLHTQQSVRILHKQTLAFILVVLCLLGTAHHVFVPLKEELVPHLLPEGGGLIGGILVLALHRLLDSDGTAIFLGVLWLVVVVALLPFKKLHAAIKRLLFGSDQENNEQIQEEKVRSNAARVNKGQRKRTENSASGASRWGEALRQQKQGQPQQATTATNSNNGFVNDIYKNDEFANFTDGIKKPGVFRNILDRNKKTVYDEEPIKQEVANDPVQIPEWEEEKVAEATETRPTVVTRPTIHYNDIRIVNGVTMVVDKQQAPRTQVPSQEAEETNLPEVGEKPKMVESMPEPEETPVIVSKQPQVINNEYRQSEEAIATSAAEAAQSLAELSADLELDKPGLPASEETELVETVVEPSKHVESGVINTAPAEVSVVEVRTEETPKVTIYDSADKIGSEMKNVAVEEAVSEDDAYKLPPLDLLDEPQASDPASYEKDIMEQCAVLEQTLADFKVRANVIAVTRGPSVTRFELQPAPGVKVSSVVNLADDIALRLAAPGVRIEAPIPGKSAIGIEAPNIKNDMVCFREVVDNDAVRTAESRLCIGLGKDISGNIISADLAKMPHLLVAGSTGSGKSVCINTIIAGILYKARPEEVKLILVDPKVVELSNYNGIPHLLTPVVTEPKKAASALHWAVAEMEKRYQMFADNNVRNIETYNKRAEEKMPFIVIIIDELSDLMMVAKVDVEDAILRLAQKARAAGIHLILATQRPSVDVITGIVKANIPSRIAFAVSSQTDSRTILDTGGAEKLLGKGDMLFAPIGMNKPVRVQGAFVTDAELNNIVDYIVAQSIPVTYTEEVTQQELASDAKNNQAEETAAKNDTPFEDELFPDALRLVLDMGQASSSMLQRRYRIGYTRAARLVDTMEELGIVGKSLGSKPREVIISRQEAEERFLNME